MIQNKRILYLLIFLYTIIIFFCAIKIIYAGFLYEPANSGAQAEDQELNEIVIHLESRTLELLINGEISQSYSIAVGHSSSPTPMGEFEVINKMKYPGGAYGTRWIGISAPHIGIHGTNAPGLIGQAVSGGCIRLKNEDIEELFSYVSIGTSVVIMK